MADARRATLKDVAAASGVSRATVSFVLNATPNQTISPATRARVLQAVRDLGYKPHTIARALREGASRIVIMHIDTGLEGNYSRSYIRGLDQELALHDHVLLVRHGPATAEATRQALDTINPRAILQFGEPYLTGHELDDYGGGRLDGLAAHAAIQIGHLAERGHRHVALAIGEQAPLVKTRLRFTRDALRTCGLAPLVELVVPRPRAAGAAAVATFRNAHPEVTAIAGYDDDVALRTLTALADLGVAVPDEVAVIGFDDTEYGALFNPALTTVHIDAEAHGRRTARSILGLDMTDLMSKPASVIVRASA
ncbi:DNA-binding LacI/PurR family transcriptional regulator [Actinoplanes tereljensis]|uniref:LacI family transcriptional regulator n=1 Tax=Paractinoplanes tereljensis TaxID=571912 RepID=A0A919TV97_9ACTN|nr:LacI family DNA-binding transcriptional regulator [Actinoplanes tereljensis]GIF23706.1 LacI family transcriptional regulator [Actinoplanes tereljensis]